MVTKPQLLHYQFIKSHFFLSILRKLKHIFLAINFFLIKQLQNTKKYADFFSAFTDRTINNYVSYFY